MTRWLFLLALFVCALPGVAGTPSVPELSENTPAPPTEEQRDAIKRTLLARAVRLTEDQHRITPDSAQKTLTLARQLGVPGDFLSLLSREAGVPMGGRAAYEHRQAMQALSEHYGIDALQIRLFAEGLRNNRREAEQLISWLPMRYLFNTITEEKKAVLNEETRRAYLEALRGMYAKMLEIYATVSSHDSAEAAAEQLLGCLPDMDRTLPIRFVIRRVGARRVPEYDEIVGEVAHAISVQRKRLFESAFYSSQRMAALDALLCF